MDTLIEYYKKNDFHRLRALVKGYGAEGVTIHKAIWRSKGQKKASLRYRKQVVGNWARSCYLAYGLVRGIPYKNVEKHCGEHNKPYADSIYNVLKSVGENSYYKEWNIEKIQAWLNDEKYIEKPAKEIPPKEEPKKESWLKRIFQ